MVALSHVTSELASAGVLGTWTTVVRHQSSSSANSGSDPPRTAYSACGATTTTPRSRSEIESKLDRRQTPCPNLKVTETSVDWWAWYVISNDNLSAIHPRFGIGISSTRVHAQNRGGKGYAVPDADAVRSWKLGEWTRRASCVMEPCILSSSACCTSILHEDHSQLLSVFTRKLYAAATPIRGPRPIYYG